MENTYLELTKACADAGTNLNEVCRLANVDRSVIQKWKHKDPKSIVILKKIKRVIESKQNRTI